MSNTEPHQPQNIHTPTEHEHNNNETNTANNNNTTTTMTHQQHSLNTASSTNINVDFEAHANVDLPNNDNRNDLLPASRIDSRGASNNINDDMNSDSIMYNVHQTIVYHVEGIAKLRRKYAIQKNAACYFSTHLRAALANNTPVRCPLCTKPFAKAGAGHHATAHVWVQQRQGDALASVLSCHRCNHHSRHRHDTQSGWNFLHSTGVPELDVIFYFNRHRNVSNEEDNYISRSNDNHVAGSNKIDTKNNNTKKDINKNNRTVDSRNRKLLRIRSDNLENYMTGYIDDGEEEDDRSTYMFDVSLLSEFSPEHMANYTQGRCCGSGSYGEVFSATLTSGEEIAIKVVETAKLQNEIRMLKTIPRHNNVIRYYGSCSDPMDSTKSNIFLELAEGSLLDYLATNDPTEEKAQYLTRKILLGLQHIHSSRVVHGDIKAANILLDCSFTPKIADFGGSKLCSNASPVECRDAVGTRLWMAPEVVTEKRFSAKADVWSLGCVVVEMLNGGSHPWSDVPDNECIAFFAGDPTTAVPLQEKGRRLSGVFKDFLSQCFEHNPVQRATAKQLLLHPWLSDAPHRPSCEWSIPPGSLRRQRSVPTMMRNTHRTSTKSIKGVSASLP